MLIPRYYFYNDFTKQYDYFLTQPHIRKTFLKNEYLWKPGEPLNHVYYILSGIGQALVPHEDGRQKILSFHIDLTQENIADILTVNRVNAARSLLRLRDEGIIEPHRKWIEILDLDALVSYCSQETLLP